MPRLPITLRADGRYQVRRGGKTYYLGRDETTAMRRYHELGLALGKAETPSRTLGLTTVADACNAALEAKSQEEIGPTALADWARQCRRIVEHFGRGRTLASISRQQWREFRAAEVEGVSPHTSAKRLRVTRSLLRFTREEGLADVDPGRLLSPPGARAMRLHAAASRSHYEPEEVRGLIEAATGTVRACVLLGISAGFGPNDCSLLRWSDIKGEFIESVRSKTGLPRRAWLWPEVLEGLDLPLLSAQGLPLVEVHRSTSGRLPTASHLDRLAVPFRTLCRKAGVPCLGHYALRRTAATIGGELGDYPALQAFLGHAMAGSTGRYIRSVSEDALRRLGEHVRGRVLA